MKGFPRVLLWCLTALSMVLSQGLWHPAAAQDNKPPELRLDVKRPVILPEAAANLCPPGSATLYRQGRRICIKCPSDYSAVEMGDDLACMRSQARPGMRTPDGYQPEFKPLASDGRCPVGLKPVTLHGKKYCVQCKPGYRYHPYYGQGKCITCTGAESLNEIGGKIMCLTCPTGSQMVGTYPSSNMSCVCTSPKVFAWGSQGYGCYSPPAP